MGTPCDSCHAGCCRAFVVPITGTDVLRLERTGLDFWDFAVRWSDPDGSIAQRHAPQLHFADTGDEPFVLGLMHTPSATLPGSTCCRFLREAAPTPDAPLGTAACSLYEDRPRTCRVFPMKFNQTRELVQLEHVPPHGRSSDDHLAYKLCPRDWTVDEVDAIEMPATIATAEHEMQLFHKIAGVWNRRRGEWTAFPDFLRQVYNSLVRVAEPPADHPATVPFHRPVAVATTRTATEAAADRRAA